MQSVNEVKQIAYNYVFRSTFIFDVVSVFPFIYIIDYRHTQDLLLIKMLRLYKLQVKIIDAD
jgi:hypothetical protein